MRNNRSSMWVPTLTLLLSYIQNIICGGLRILATDVYERWSEEGEPLDAEADRQSSVEQDAEVLSQASTKLLPALFKLVESIQGTSTKAPGAGETMDVDEGKKGGSKNVALDSQRSQSVIEAIAAFARLVPKSYLHSLFKKVMQRLLAASQSEERETEKICTLLGLSQALVTSQALDDASISLLYRAIRPLIRSDEHEARVQKRAYKVLLAICQCHPSFVTEPELLRELIELLLDSIMTSQVSARHMRLKCMALIVEGFEDGNAEHNVSNPNRFLFVATTHTTHSEPTWRFISSSGCHCQDCSRSSALSQRFQRKGERGCVPAAGFHGSHPREQG